MDKNVIPGDGVVTPWYQCVEKFCFRTRFTVYGGSLGEMHGENL